MAIAEVSTASRLNETSVNAIQGAEAASFFEQCADTKKQAVLYIAGRSEKPIFQDQNGAAKIWLRLPGTPATQ